MGRGNVGTTGLGPVDGYASGLIRLKARRMALQLELCGADEDDIAQALRLEVLMQAKAYAPEKGDWRPFIRVVIERRFRKLVRKYLRAQRHHLVDGTEMGAGISQADLFRRVHRGAVGPVHDPGIRMDVREILSRMSDEDRALCQDLGAESISETARLRGLPRSTVQDHIAKLKKSFQSLNPTRNPPLTPKHRGY